MKRRNPVLALTSIVLVFFLFAPIVARSFNTFPGNSKIASLTKSSQAPTKADSQMPFEEKEKEELADNSLNQIPMNYILTEYLSFSPEVAKSYPDNKVTGFLGNTPIYLSIRSIQI